MTRRTDPLVLHADVRPPGLAWIADTAADFAVAIDEAHASDRAARLAQADAFLAELSWDLTWPQMWRHVEQVLARSTAPLYGRATGAGAGAAGSNAILARSED